MCIFLLNFHDDRNLTYINNFGLVKIEKRKITCKRKIMNWLINLFLFFSCSLSLFFKFFLFFDWWFWDQRVWWCSHKVRIYLMVDTKEWWIYQKIEWRNWLEMEVIWFDMRFGVGVCSFFISLVVLK